MPSISHPRAPGRAESAVVDCDISGTIRTWNPDAAQLYGWAAKDVLGCNVVSILIVDELRKFSLNVLPAIQQGRSRRGTYVARRSDGTRFQVEVNGTPVADAQDVLVGLRFSAHEVVPLPVAPAARTSLERFEMLEQATCDVVRDWDVVSGEVWWSGKLGESFGYTRTEFGRGIASWYGAIHPADRLRIVGSIRRLFDSDAVRWQDEYRFCDGNGDDIAIFDRALVQRDASGAVTRMVASMVDITEFRQTEASRPHRSHAAQQSLLVEFGQNAMASTDLDAIMEEAVGTVARGLGVEFCRVVQIAPDGDSLVCTGACGWSEGGMALRTPVTDILARERYRYILRSPEAVVVGDFRTETRFERSEQLRDHRIASAMDMVIRGPGGPFGVLGAYSRDPQTFDAEKIGFLRSIVAILETVVARVRAEEKVAHFAQLDSLTGLPERNLFQDRIAQTLIQAERNNWLAAVLCIGLDRFKIVNETYGHSVGDTLLMLIALRLGTCVRSCDTVGRLGGDEFGIALSNLATADDANAIAQNVLQALAHPFKLDDQETHLTACIGIAMYPDDSNDAGILLKSANTAMFRAKEHSGNTIHFYTQALNARVRHRLDLERELRHALERQELELLYQPQVSLHTGRIVAAEALLRWRHPQRGLLTPIDFLDVAEESGLIVPIGRWVVDMACTHAMGWHRSGHRELTIAVNISPGEIRRGGVPAQVRAALERAGMDPRHLEVEITESMSVDNAESFIQTLQDLKNVGVMIAIDDFGIGYSNLSYLKRFPIDTLKIDQIFIRDIVTDTDDAAIVRAIIAIAHQFKFDIVAEGVETEAQALFLRRNHVELVQGFLFSAPLEALAFGRLLDTYMARPLPTSHSVSARSLLLVDDEENILRALKRTLRSDGYDIHTANSAREGLDLLARTPIGVVMSDERMPGMNGSEFLGRVKTLYPGTVRMMLSGYTDLKAVTAAVNEGAIYKFLTKPWEDDRMREEIRQAFRQQEEKSSQRAERNGAAGEH